MLYKINDWNQAAAFEKWAEENGIEFEQLDDENYLDSCPNCGDSDFWHGGHCGHCGHDV